MKKDFHAWLCYICIIKNTLKTRTNQLKEGDPGTTFKEHEPPGCTAHGSNTNINWGEEEKGRERDRERETERETERESSLANTQERSTQTRILIPVHTNKDYDSPPMAMYLKNSHPEMSGSLGERGGFCIMSRSGGLNPRAVAGSPSVTRLTQRSWTGIRASGMPSAAVKNMLEREGVSEGEEREREREKRREREEGGRGM